MFRSLKWTAVLLVVAAIIALLWIYSGNYDIGADVPHQPWTEALIDFARDRSIATHAATIVVPSDLSDPARMRRGAGNYDAMCTECHLRPGLADSELRRGLYPQPPDLTIGDPDERAATRTVSQFWVIKHGIKMTAMPAWSASGVDDESVWDLVAFIEELPTLDEASYHALVESSAGHVHSHTGHDRAHATADGEAETQHPHD